MATADDLAFVEYMLSEAYKVLAERLPDETGPEAAYLKNLANGVLMMLEQTRTYATMDDGKRRIAALKQKREGGGVAR